MFRVAPPTCSLLTSHALGLSLQEVRDTFRDRMGWTDRETVALIGGGHTLGRTHGNCTLDFAVGAGGGGGLFVDEISSLVSKPSRGISYCT